MIQAVVFLFMFLSASSAFSETLDQKIGQMLLVGFHGTSSADDSLQAVQQWVKRGQVGGLVFYEHNILNKKQLMSLLQLMKDSEQSTPLFLAVEQEGGAVQQLNAKNGFRNFMSARDVAATLAPEKAYHYYKKMATLLQEIGINLNLAPVVDLDYGSESSSIGKRHRSFSAYPKTVVSYASAMIRAHHDAGIWHCLKYAPGTGSARGNTQEDIVDISSHWDEGKELIPYQDLIKNEKIDMIMTSHVKHKKYDPDFPLTLSYSFLNKKFRNKAKWDGIVISDDLMKSAIHNQYELEEAVVKSIHAGIDILMFSNFDSMNSTLPQNVIQIVKDAIQRGELTEDRINKSYEKIRTLKAESSTLSSLVRRLTAPLKN